MRTTAEGLNLVSYIYRLPKIKRSAARLQGSQENGIHKQSLKEIIHKDTHYKWMWLKEGEIKFRTEHSVWLFKTRF